MCAYTDTDIETDTDNDTDTDTDTDTTERYRTLNVTCHMRAEITWHCSDDICVSSVHSNKPQKAVHNQVALPLKTNRPSKRHILNGKTHKALECVCQ